MKIRGFEVAKGFENKGINLPERKTAGSAGYDFECAETAVIPSLPKTILGYIQGIIGLANDIKPFKPTLVKTGVKAYMLEDEELQLRNRSSNPLKKGLILTNGVGTIDSDYYGNVDNDGHIMFQFINFLPWDVTIEKGEAIGQGIFSKYLKADDDIALGERVGGHGSTTK